MGEFPVENVLEHVLREVTRGWNHMDCEKLFPRSVHSLIHSLMNLFAHFIIFLSFLVF
jgi:hypothetical protein